MGYGVCLACLFCCPVLYEIFSENKTRGIIHTYASRANRAIIIQRAGSEVLACTSAAKDFARALRIDRAAAICQHEPRARARPTVTGKSIASTATADHWRIAAEIQGVIVAARAHIGCGLSSSLLRPGCGAHVDGDDSCVRAGSPDGLSSS